MKFFSIKWKLSLALVVIALGLVGCYVLIAKDTFEKDKIAYVFDNQEAQIEATAKDFDSQIERALFIGKTILSTYDLNTKLLNPMGQRLFDEQKNLLGVDLFDVNTRQSIFKIEKEPGALAAAPMVQVTELKGAEPDVRGAGDQKFIISLQQQGPTGLLILRVLSNVKPSFPPAQRSQILFLADSKAPLITSGSMETVGADAVKDLAEDMARGRGDHAQMRNVKGQQYLVSAARTRFGDFHVASMIGQREVLSALQVLWKRSIIFLIFSSFATILIAYLLAAGLTGNLKVLADAAIRIGAGNFADPPTVKSKDEVGLLSSAFQKMVSEIARLLLETKDKARIDEELKTARLVQESLFPAKPAVEIGTFSLAGMYVTSTECGGDWWYYYMRGDDLYIVVADATGHGTPAALITAAARSLFSKLEHSGETLLQIVKDWDHATSSSSGRKVYMTAFILKIDVKTGKGVFVNACHEPPLLMKNGEVGEYIALEKGSTLGEGQTERCVEQEFSMDPGDRFVMFTDGVFSVINKEGKSLSDIRFAKAVAKLAAKCPQTKDLAEEIHQLLEKQREGTPYPDDVTLVVLDRKA